MKFLLVAVLLTLTVCAVCSIPAVHEDGDEFESGYDEGPNAGLRQRRVTCDLMSFGGKVGHSACAANCISMGKAGGRCNDGVCQCRKTTMSDLWKKRFG